MKQRIGFPMYANPPNDDTNVEDNKYTPDELLDFRAHDALEQLCEVKDALPDIPKKKETPEENKYSDGPATHWMPLKEKPSKILCIVGLPGSGKTHTAGQYTTENDVVLDDINDIKQLPDKLDLVNFLVITDPNFCITSIRKDVEKIIIEKYNSQPEWFFFENNKEKCLINVKYRNDGRKVIDFINSVSQIYEIPEGYEPIEIWQS